MSDLHIILHCLPREIDELDRIVNHLKRSSHFLESNDEVILDCYLQEGSLKSKLRKANKNNSDYAIIVGEEELENNTVIIKSLKDELTDQKVVSVDQLDSFFQDL